MKFWRIRYLVLGASLFLAVGIFLTLTRSPGTEVYKNQMGLPISSEQKDPTGTKLKVTFLGVSTLLFDDGETAWMTDGFFSHPGLFKVLFGKVSPNEIIISESLKKTGVTSLAAVIPIHSHYDHALDSAAVAIKTGAKLIGSSSTANIGRGSGLAEKQIQLVKNGDVVEIGKFKITFLASQHSPGGFYEGEILKPLAPPQPAKNFRMGDCYSLLVEHEGRSLLVHGSAGFIPGALKNHKAEVVFLGIGTLGRQTQEFKEHYWDEVVKTTGAARVILIHWDNFFAPLEEPLKPLPWPADNFKASMDFLNAQGAKDHVDVRLPVLWQASNPFSDI
jgi:L-ascorbate metabolism protein UlaG (beta-lactamase superfamily)